MGKMAATIERRKVLAATAEAAYVVYASTNHTWVSMRVEECRRGRTKVVDTGLEDEEESHSDSDESNQLSHCPCPAEQEESNGESDPTDHHGRETHFWSTTSTVRVDVGAKDKVGVGEVDDCCEESSEEHGEEGEGCLNVCPSLALFKDDWNSAKQKICVRPSHQ